MGTNSLLDIVVFGKLGGEYMRRHADGMIRFCRIEPGGRRHRVDQEGGLAEVGAVEPLLRPLEAEAGEIDVEDFRGLIKKGSRGREG